ncbi:MAG: hypothetical protein HPY44_00965 [Armatimonadetes bacterium]|nr:hypothetical protein [Armatimonadota bacterium]
MSAEGVFVTGLFEWYCTVDDVFRLLAGHDVSAIGDSDALELRVRGLMPVSMAAIDAEAGRDFLLHSDEVVMCDGQGEGRLMLGPLGVSPLLAVHSVVVGGRKLSTEEYVVYYPEAVIRLRSGEFPEGLANVEVTADWGYNGAPQEIRMAQARLVAAQILSECAGDRGSVERLQIGDYAVDYGSGGEHAGVIERWVTDARSAARSYRKLRLAAI